jgi:hypothetical protein
MKKLIRFSLIAAAAFDLALPALAQTPIVPKTYPLTNGIFSIANGATNIAGSGSITLNSPAFPIWRGRGFVLHTGIYGTNAGTDNITFTIQTVTPYTQGGVTRTNWNTASNATVVIAENGTAEVYGSSLIPPTTVDNEALCRISTVANAHASTVWLDPTNTFISVTP